MTNLIAEVRPDEIFPFLLGAIFFLTPIVAILTKHQQKMAILMRQNAPQHDPDTEALRREVEALKQLVMQQTIAIDNLSSGRGSASGPPPIEHRLNQESGR